MSIDRAPELIQQNIFEQLQYLSRYPFEFSLSKAEKHLDIIFESHKVYLSLNFAIALILSMRIFYLSRSIYRKVLFILISACFLLSILYTQAITVIGAILIIAFAAPFFYLKKVTFKWGYVLITLLGITVVYFTLFNTSYSNKNTSAVSKLISYFHSGKRDKGIDKRAYIYDCSIESIKRSPYIGYGAGDVQSQLDTCYKVNNYTVAEFKSEGIPINSHNYYFHLLLATGVTGLLLFIVMLCLNLRFAISEKSWHYLFFLVLITINLLTENLFVRIYGVVPFVFFNSLFCLNLIKDE